MDNKTTENNKTETKSTNKEIEIKNNNISIDTNDKIKINTATENMLITLSSIGKTIAKSIIEFEK